MTEQQIERCTDLRVRKEKYEKALNTLLDNADADIVISYMGSYIYRVIYVPVCSTENDIKELNLVVERFIRDKIKKIDDELKEL